MRSQIPQYISHDSTPLDGGLEVYVFENPEVAPEPTRAEQDGRTERRDVTMLINPVDAPGARKTIGAARHVFLSGRCSRHMLGRGDVAQGLQRLLAGMNVDSADAVIYADPWADESQQDVQDMVDALRTARHGLIVLVDSDCSRWSAATGLSGFVRGASRTTPATAVSVFLLLTALLASDTLTCLDHEDVAACLGAADRPAVLAEAFWLREAGDLVYTSATSAAAIGRSVAVTLLPLAADLRLNEVRSMMNALRADAGAACGVTFQAPVDAFTAQLMNRSIVLMTMICKPTA